MHAVDYYCNQVGAPPGLIPRIETGPVERRGSVVVGSGSGSVVVVSGRVVNVDVVSDGGESSASAADGPPTSAIRHAARPTHCGSQRLIRR